MRRIARLADVGPGDLVLEIGAGLGSLTLALVETGAEVHAMEIDRYLLEPLRSVVAPHGVTVHHANALEADYEEILGGRDGRRRREPALQRGDAAGAAPARELSR